MGRVLLGGIAVVLAIPVFLELGFRVAVGGGFLDTPRPGGTGQGLWQGHHPDYGVWHRPGITARQVSHCFDVEIRTNSLGVRDIERSRESDRPRAVFLGDSFSEGWGVTEAERLSNRLETASGFEHLNFAMAHFGTYQQYLVYRDLARHFDHDVVFVGIVPLNDFLDMDYTAAQEMGWYEYRYRPYLLGEGPDARHLDHREPAWRRWLRLHSYTFHALRTALRDRSLRSMGPQPSRFYEFSEADYRRLETILGMLIEAARDKRVVLVLMPTVPDLRRYSAGPGFDPLSQRLRDWATAHDALVVNLLPGMAGDLRRARGYFHSCDRHWNTLGHAVAFDYVLRGLGSDFYSARP
jgi:hypothetical protein